MISQVRLYLFLTSGTFFIAASFQLFQRPNEIASGGITGASLLISSVTNLETALILWILNGLLLVLGLYFLEKDTILKAIVGSILLPFFVYLGRNVEPLTEDSLLAAIYGGIGVGVGLGFIFRGTGNIGGFTLIAQILHRYYAIKPSVSILVLDGSVMLLAGIIFSPEKALYALIGAFLTRRTMELVQGKSKMAYIITSLEHEDRINQAVLYTLDRGLTRISGSGGYSNRERVIMMIVLHPSKAIALKGVIEQIDPHAFIIFCETTEVIGEGFSPLKKPLPKRKLTSHFSS